ncbi:myb-like protein I [Papaver somniferum]|uniref:myb-like protein I n=1 Tax=Papaver somniferum TaxID=3469 RepID=UPI000E6FCB7D|nr:myb-like protein I [Papaver somniferum]
MPPKPATRASSAANNDDSDDSSTQDRYSDVLGLSTAREIWEYIETTCTTQFASRKSMLRNQLQSIRRGNRSVEEYLQQIKSITDNLASINEKVSNSDIIMHILNGLGRDFNNFIISSQNREVPFTFVEIKARLISHQQWLKDQDSEMNTMFYSQNASDMYGKNTNSGKKNNNFNKNKSNFKNNVYSNGSGSSSSGSSGNNGSSGRNSGSTSGGNSNNSSGGSRNNT